LGDATSPFWGIRASPSAFAIGLFPADVVIGGAPVDQVEALILLRHRSRD
jgi:hypothetical protein